MVKKKSNTRRRRKKSNTTINEGERQHQGAKRQKTEATGVSDAKNRLVSAIKAMIDSMNEEHLYSVMVYAGTVGKELMGSDKAAADTSAAKAIEDTSAA
mmetsp:Transcript_22908/g.51155  ORF Transcript_22908/g.51155 Transcript_22908/m.51155 type:complete len:99 (-) Transcript_22908:44-340(-)